MKYELPSPLYGETHVEFYEVLVNPGESVRLSGNLGSLDGEDFVRNGDFPAGGFRRTISGEEFQAFLEYVDGERAGAPTEGTSNFRDADLGYWLTTYGWRDEESTWTPPAEEEDEEAAS